MTRTTQNSEHLESWHQLIRTKDLPKLEDMLAEDAVLHSPIVHRPLAGRAIVVKYLSAAFEVFLSQDFHYIRECFNEDSAILEFETTVDDITVNGVDMIRWDENGKIVDFKVMVRPLKAVNIIHQKMAAMLERAY